MATSDSPDRLSIWFKTKLLHSGIDRDPKPYVIHFDNLSSDEPTDKITEYARKLYGEGYVDTEERVYTI